MINSWWLVCSESTNTSAQHHSLLHSWDQGQEPVQINGWVLNGNSHSRENTLLRPYLHSNGKSHIKNRVHYKWFVFAYKCGIYENLYIEMCRIYILRGARLLPDDCIIDQQFWRVHQSSRCQVLSPAKHNRTHSDEVCLFCGLRYVTQIHKSAKKTCWPVRPTILTPSMGPLVWLRDK